MESELIRPHLLFLRSFAAIPGIPDSSRQRIEDDEAVAARGFGAVERLVGAAVERVEVGLGARRYTHADGDAEMRAARAVVRVHLAQDAPRDLRRRVEVATGCEHQELIPAEPRAHVLLAHARAHR